MRQNESNLTMTTDVAVTTNTTNMEEKGMKGFFKNMKKKVLPAVAGSVTGAMLMTSTCFAAGTGTTAVTQPLENLKTLVIAVIGAVGVIILAKNVMEFAQAYQQQDSSTMNSALKSLQLFNNAVGILRIIFCNPCFNAGGIKDCHVGKSWIQFLAYRFGQVYKMIEHRL